MVMGSAETAILVAKFSTTRSPSFQYACSVNARRTRVAFRTLDREEHRGHHLLVLLELQLQVLVRGLDLRRRAVNRLLSAGARRGSGFLCFRHESSKIQLGGQDDRLVIRACRVQVNKHELASVTMRPNQGPPPRRAWRHRALAPARRQDHARAALEQAADVDHSPALEGAEKFALEDTVAESLTAIARRSAALSSRPASGPRPPTLPW